MHSEEWRQVEEIFDAALNRPREARPRFLSEVCGDDLRLRQRVEQLLASDDEAGTFLESAAADFGIATLLQETADGDESSGFLGRRIGAYRLNRELGRGGMGAVFEASRDDGEFQHRVAIKLIKRGMDTDFILKRFRYERQILATLDHPNIGRLLDGGTTEDGLPYFVMDFIEGEPLNVYCERNQLSISERLRLIQQVCGAIDHAHQQQVVHRDIKPSNILVTKEGLVKLLDFGIAKILARELAGDTVDSTATLMRLMTPYYACPEQVQGIVVTPASDVYSLGVLLYELLTGRRPYQLNSRAPHEIARIICEEDPELMSVVISRANTDRGVGESTRDTGGTETNSLPGTGRVNRSDTGDMSADENRSLRAELSGDLDNIVFMAMQKDPQRRYGSAAELCDDIQRHLDGIPVLAPAPLQRSNAPSRSSVVRVKDALGRYPLLSSFAVIFVVVVTIAVSAWLLQRVQRRAVSDVSSFASNGGSGTRSRATRLTTLGNVLNAVTSPDGKSMAYTADDKGGQSLWLSDTVTGSSTSPNLLRQLETGKFAGLSFTNDGRFVNYVVVEEKNNFGSLYRVPVNGGPTEKVLDDLVGRVSYSPDDKRFVFVRSHLSEGDVFLMTAAADGTNERQIGAYKFPEMPANATWSPDGRTIAATYFKRTEKGVYGTVIAIPVDGGSQRTVTPQLWSAVAIIVWQPDGKALYMLGQAEGSLISQIWRVSNETGAVELVTNDVSNYTGLSVARSTGEIVSVKAEPQSKLWITREEDSRQATAVPFSSLAGLSGIAWTADNRLIYTATDDRTLNLWTMDLNGNSKKQLTNAGSNSLPVVSPDGRYIVFMSNRNAGSNHLWRMDMNGGKLLELTHGEEDQFPSFSPDGKWIVYTQVEAGKWYAARVSIDGGNSSRLSNVPAMCPVVSPDGKQIAFLTFDNYLAKPAVMPFEGGNPTKIFDFIVPLVGSNDVSYLVQWTHDSKAIELAKDDHGVSNLWRLPLDGATPKQITDFNTDHIFYFSRSPNGKEIALARGSISSDAVKISDLN